MKIVQYPHPSLRYVARPLTTIDAKIHKAAAEMIELMFAHNGLGLAAPQVGLPYQMLILNLTGEGENAERKAGVFLNPVIVDRKGSIEGEEGCLSFPGLYQKVRRAKTVQVRAYNLQGEALDITATDLMSRAWQHEVDHLHGVLFIDKMGPIGKLASRGALKEFEQEYARAQERGDIPSDADIQKELAALAAQA